jgi:phospholipase/carboxylesterase
LSGFVRVETAKGVLPAATAIGPLCQDPRFELAFRLREPLPALARSCVVLLHGVGSNETDLGDLAMGLAPDVLVVLPRGDLQLAPGRYGWFHVGFAAGVPVIDAEAADASRRKLIGFVEALQTVYGVDSRHTLIAGFSQGGIMSAGVALSAPERVAGFGLLSGRILPELEPHLAPRERLAPLAAFIAHGEFDSILPLSWAKRADDWLTRLGVRHRTHFYPAGHVLNAQMRADFLAWIDAQRA